MSKVAEILAVMPALLEDAAEAAGLANDIGNALGSEIDDDGLRELRNALAAARPRDPIAHTAATVMAEMIDGFRSARRAPRNAEVVLRDGLHRRILIALERGPSTTGELAETLGQGEPLVSRALERLRELDLVEPPQREQLDRRRAQHNLTLFAKQALARLDVRARRDPSWRLSPRPPLIEVAVPDSDAELAAPAQSRAGTEAFLATAQQRHRAGIEASTRQKRWIPWPVDSDADIFQLVAAGDLAGASELVVTRYNGAIRLYISRMLPESESADDLLQMVFVEAIHQLPRFAGQSSLRTWLLAVARRYVYSAVRRRPRRDRDETTMLPTRQNGRTSARSLRSNGRIHPPGQRSRHLRCASPRSRRALPRAETILGLG